MCSIVERRNLASRSTRSRRTSDAWFARASSEPRRTRSSETRSRSASVTMKRSGKLLETRKLDLTTAVDICRSSEIASRQIKSTTSSEDVHRLKTTPKRSPSNGRARGHNEASPPSLERERRDAAATATGRTSCDENPVRLLDRYAGSAHSGTILFPAAVQSRMPEVATTTNSREIEFMRCRKNQTRTG